MKTDHQKTFSKGLCKESISGEQCATLDKQKVEFTRRNVDTKDPSKFLLYNYYVPGNCLSASHVLAHLILTMCYESVEKGHLFNRWSWNNWTSVQTINKYALTLISCHMPNLPKKDHMPTHKS